MDSQFNTLARSYHDNFLEYKLTGNPSYQQAYQSAQKDLDRIVSTMSDENSKQKKDISDFYNQDLEGKIRDARYKRKDAQRKITLENDQVISAEMRSSGGTAEIVDKPDMTNRWITLGSMTLIAILLTIL
jgi:hypothetical protein